jgi:TonB family protein
VSSLRLSWPPGARVALLFLTLSTASPALGSIDPARLYGTWQRTEGGSERFLILRKDGTHEYWSRDTTGTQLITSGKVKFIDPAKVPAVPKISADYVLSMAGWTLQLGTVSGADTLLLDPAGESHSDSTHTYVRIPDDAFRPPLKREPPRTVSLPPWVSYDPDRSVDVPPSPLHMERPIYPEFAREAQIRGVVRVHVLVGVDGRVKNAKLVQGVTGLNDTVLHAARQWTFTPARHENRPVASWTQLAFEFP